MCEAFEGIKEEGREEGLKEGMEKGLKKGKEDKYKSWVTAAGNLEKRGMNNAEIASILGISARFVFRIIPAIDFDGLCSKLQKHNGLFFKLNMIQFYILYGDEFKIIRQLSA